MTEAKPCPFCGATNTTFDTNQGTKWGFVVCRSCDARGPEVRTQYEEPEAGWGEAALKEWNNRV